MRQGIQDIVFAQVSNGAANANTTMPSEKGITRGIADVVWYDFPMNSATGIGTLKRRPLLQDVINC